VVQDVYRAQGIRGVQVIIPPQELGDKPLAVQVVEPKMNEFTIDGNRWFGDKNIRRFFERRITTGEGVLVADKLDDQLDRVNRHPDRQVTAILTPADEPGRTDIELTVKEREVFYKIPPFHYAVETNSTGTPNVGRLMTAHTFQYTNLFDRDHTASVQWTFPPGTFSDNQVVGASYMIPDFLPALPWDLSAAVYGGYSRANADTVIDTLSIVGEGWTVGGQVSYRLPEYRGWEPSLTLGAETTQLDNSIRFGSFTDIDSEVGLLPVYAKLSFHNRDRWGSTIGRIGVRHNFDGAVHHSDLENFQEFRQDSDPSFTSFQYGLERYQKLLKDWILHVGATAQYSQNRLIPGEQLRIGGGSTVRGYEQSEVSGDSAIILRTELQSPDWPMLLSRVLDKQEALKFVAFFDLGAGFASDPLPGDPRDESVTGCGFGFRYQFMQHFLGSVDLGWPLEDSANTEAGELQVYFRFSLSF
jgi:hemolysin activation/secretion protein